jgi:hypothetical protein
MGARRLILHQMTAVSVKLYECTVKRVQPESRVMDCVSRAGRKFQDLTYLLPYINALGSGIDAVPQEKDSCIVLAEDAPSDFAFCIGFRVPFTFNEQYPDSLELGDRQVDLDRSSIAVRAVGEDGTEAKMICYRGGSVLIGSGKQAITLYTPIDNSIIHLFNNWEMIGPGGFVKWKREEGSDSVTYESEYRTKTGEDAPFKVNVGIGGDGDPFRLEVSRGGDAIPPLSIHVKEDGLVEVQGVCMEFEAQGRIEFKAPNIVLNGRRILARDDHI